MRFWLMILAMLSLALLPGPAHALTRDHLLPGHAQAASAHYEDASAGPVESGHHHDCPGHHHAPACAAACCAPMCSLDPLPIAAAGRVALSQAPPLPTSDRPGRDADASRSPRPPESA